MMNTQRSAGFGGESAGMNQKLMNSNYAQQPNINQSLESQGPKNQWTAAQ